MSEEQAPERRSPLAIILAALAVAVGLGTWLYWDRPEPLQVPVDISPVTATPPTQPAAETVRDGEISRPAHPLEPVTQTPTAEAPPLPALEDSDGPFQEALAVTFGENLEPLLAESRLIEKFVASLDSLTGRQLTEKTRVLGKLPDPFVATALEDGQRFQLGADNYRRYDEVIRLVAATDANATAGLYRRFYPLLQESYGQLGYPDRYFNDRVVAVIDHLLATPEPGEPVILVRPHVLYKFDNPDLEALSSGQKLLIRIGPAHRATVKKMLRELRGLIAG